MTRTYVKLMTIAALVGGAMFATQPAYAMGFKNCTGEQIRIKIYDNSDVGRRFANPFGNKTLGVGDYHWFKVGKELKQVSVFRSRVGKDTEVLVKGGLNSGHKFSVRKSGGRFSISTDNGCGSADTGGGGGGPVVTIPVDSGKWIGAGRKPITIRTASSTSFTLKQKGRKGKTLYTLVGRDAYRGADGTGFVMTARGQATWGNTPIRRK